MYTYNVTKAQMAGKAPYSNFNLTTGMVGRVMPPVTVCTYID